MNYNRLHGHRKDFCLRELRHCGFMLDCSDLDVGNEIKQASLRQSRAALSRAKDKTAESKK